MAWNEWGGAEDSRPSAIVRCDDCGGWKRVSANRSGTAELQLRFGHDVQALDMTGLQALVRARVLALPELRARRTPGAISARVAAAVSEALVREGLADLLAADLGTLREAVADALRRKEPAGGAARRAIGLTRPAEGSVR